MLIDNLIEPCTPKTKLRQEDMLNAVRIFGKKYFSSDIMKDESDLREITLW